MARRHGLSISLALAVADNRLSLLQAMRKRGPGERIHVGAHKKSPRARPRRVALVAVLLLALVSIGAYQGHQVLNRLQEDGRTAAADRRQQIIGATRVAKDELGHAIEISGPDPESVLMAYCRPGRHAELEIAVPVPQQTGVRWGIFTDREANGTSFAIRIQRRSGAREWFAGEGSDPIAVTDAPDLPAGTPRYPVR